MPSQKQLKWSQLRVGITVLVAGLTLGFLLFLMSGTSGFFTPRLTLKSYFDNAQGLRDGAPVRLSGVDIGNVTNIRIVPDKDKQLTPVEITMKVSSRYSYAMHRDSVIYTGQFLVGPPDQIYGPYLTSDVIHGADAERGRDGADVRQERVQLLHLRHMSHD